MRILYTPLLQLTDFAISICIPRWSKAKFYTSINIEQPIYAPEHHWRTACLYCSGISYCPYSGVIYIYNFPKSKMNKPETREGQASLGLHSKFESFCISEPLLTALVSILIFLQFRAVLPHCFPPKLIPNVQSSCLPFPFPERCFLRLT